MKMGVGVTVGLLSPQRPSGDKGHPRVTQEDMMYEGVIIVTAIIR